MVRVLLVLLMFFIGLTAASGQERELYVSPDAPPPPVPVLVEDPILELPEVGAPGWFEAVDVGILVPHLNNHLSGAVDVGGSTRNVTVPVTELDWNMATRFEIGYRFAEGAGEVLASFRNLNARGRDWLPSYDLLGGGTLQTRLDMNVGDIDYGVRDPSLGPMWDVKWRVGARVAGVYFDSRAQGALLGQRISNNFVGAGPHAVLDLWRKIGINGLALFARTEGAVVIGGLGQSFEETQSVRGVPFLGGALRDTGIQSVPVLNLQLGVGWVPPGQERLRMVAGYQYEHWWYLGYLGESRADLRAQGVFFRCEFGY